MASPDKSVHSKTEAALKKLEGLSNVLATFQADLDALKETILDIRSEPGPPRIGRGLSRKKSIIMSNVNLSMGGGFSGMNNNADNDEEVEEKVSEILHMKALSHMNLMASASDGRASVGTVRSAMGNSNSNQPLAVNDEEFEEIKIELQEAITNLQNRGEFDVITPLNPKDTELHPEDMEVFHETGTELFPEELKSQNVSAHTMEKEPNMNPKSGATGNSIRASIEELDRIDVDERDMEHRRDEEVEVPTSGWLNRINKMARRGTLGIKKAALKETGSLKEKFRELCVLEESAHSIKIFGDKVAVELERERHITYMKESGYFIIHPYSTFRYHWDVLMMLLLFSTLIILPVALAFETANLIDGTVDFFVIFDLLSDSVFLFDIFLNFRTAGIGEDDEITLEKKQIALDYLGGWFFIDLLSSFPLDLVVEGIAALSGNAGDFSALGATKLFRLLRLFKLLRVLRISRLFRYLHRWQEIMVTVGENYLRIVKLIFVMILFAHWSGCIQLMVARLMDFPPESWVTIAGIQHSSQFVQYSWALFKALSHMLSIGYGREKPQSDAEVWLIICSMLVGTAFYAIFIGNVSSILLSIDSAGRLFRERMQQVNEYLRYAKIPHPLRVRVRDYYDFKYSHKKLFDEHVILGDMSQSMREEVQLYNCRDLIKKVPFFHDIEPVIVSALVCQMEPKHYLPGDIVISEGSFGSEMYFIRTGLVEIIAKGNLLTTIGDGSYFGEIALLRDHRYRRMATVQAATHLVLYQLTRENFETIIMDYPIIKKEMQLIAYARLARVAGHQSSTNKNHNNDGESSRNTAMTSSNNNQRNYPSTLGSDSPNVTSQEASPRFVGGLAPKGDTTPAVSIVNAALGRPIGNTSAGSSTYSNINGSFTNGSGQQTPAHSIVNATLGPPIVQQRPTDPDQERSLSMPGSVDEMGEKEED
eukprot:Nk52_evm14s2506 gene=Nk52_evmTU14s2506